MDFKDAIFISLAMASMNSLDSAQKPTFLLQAVRITEVHTLDVDKHVRVWVWVWVRVYLSSPEVQIAYTKAAYIDNKMTTVRENCRGCEDKNLTIAGGSGEDASRPNMMGSNSKLHFLIKEKIERVIMARGGKKDGKTAVVAPNPEAPWHKHFEDVPHILLSLPSSSHLRI